MADDDCKNKGRGRFPAEASRREKTLWTQKNLAHHYLWYRRDGQTHIVCAHCGKEARKPFTDHEANENTYAQARQKHHGWCNRATA